MRRSVEPERKTTGRSIRSSGTARLGRSRSGADRYWFPGLFACTGDRGIVLRRRFVDGQHLVGKAAEDVGGCVEQDLFPPAFRQPGDTVADPLRA